MTTIGCIHITQSKRFCSPISETILYSHDGLQRYIKEALYSYIESNSIVWNN